MWYLALRRAAKPREEWTVTLDQHLVWMKQQQGSHKDGVLQSRNPLSA